MSVKEQVFVSHTYLCKRTWNIFGLKYVMAVPDRIKTDGKRREIMIDRHNLEHLNKNSPYGKYLCHYHQYLGRFWSKKLESNISYFSLLLSGSLNRFGPFTSKYFPFEFSSENVVDYSYWLAYELEKHHHRITSQIL